MKYFVIIGANNKTIKISKIILGGVPFGTTLSIDKSFEMMDKFLEYGGNAIDTARVYCNWLENGSSASERTIGQWIKDRNNRKDVVLITKGGHPDSSWTSRISKEAILEDIDTSLKILQTDFVDVYLLHRDDPAIPVNIIMDTLHTLVLEGKTRAIGVSNWSFDRIREANEYAERSGKTKLSISQIQWSLAQCFPEDFNDTTLICMTREEYDQYLEAGMPVMAYSSQANGLLTKAGEELEQVPEKLKKFVSPENIRRYRNLQGLCKEKGYSKTSVALNYILDNKLNGSAIIGCTSMEQLEDCIKTADITLTPQEVEGLT